jgi:hypothetical protein
VQGWSAEAVDEHTDVYLSVQCTACRRFHHVNPSTGRVLGSHEGEDE